MSEPQLIGLVIQTIAEAAACEINNSLMLGTSDQDHKKIQRIVARAIAQALAESRQTSAA